MEGLARATEVLSAVRVTARELASAGVNINPDKESRTALDALSLADCGFDGLESAGVDVSDIPAFLRTQIKNDALYKTYIDRQRRDIEQLRKDEGEIIPDGFDYSHIEGLSNELRFKLKSARPRSIAQAAKIDGMTPSAMILILGQLRRNAFGRTA
jgi:tRNA uridine 5-carboxymethylaminomethyl modification enzyme